MKAEDYAKIWIESGKSTETLMSITILLIKETSTIARERGVGSDEAMASVIKEIDDKWRAFANLFPGEFSPEAFRTSIFRLVSTVRPFHHLVWPTKKVPDLPDRIVVPAA